MMDKENLKDELIKYSTTFTNSSITCEGVTLPLIKNVIDNFDDTPTAGQAWEKIAEDKGYTAAQAKNIFSLHKSEKPEIPKFVADWIRGFRILDVTDLNIIRLYFRKEIEKKCEQWITDNFNDFIKALANGYTEKAPVWVVLKNAKYFRAFTGEYDESEGFEYVLSMYEGNAHTFTDKQKAEAVATLVDGTVKEWSE